ncbi:MAG: acetylxylan esterase, partial [Paludibacteraceae bacterium]|nr:acetylxylan esterase [Paludibacteraceae bacterium]
YNTSHNDDRDRYYYKRVYLGCVRAVDWLCTLPQVDTTRLAVYGGSRGGALSIVTAALHEKITCLSANYPALCEIAGFYHGRAGGWPKIFKDKEEVALAEKVRVSEYYDVVNFARCVRVPGFYLWGYNDQVCCPTSVYSAYNVITAPKERYLFLDGAHWMHSQHREQQAMWLIDHLTKGK